MSIGGFRRIAIRIVGALAGLLMLFLAAGLVLPRSVEVSRSIRIEARPDAVFPHLNTLAEWTDWTPWGDIESTLEGPAAGPGATRSWDDPNFGSGSLTITEAQAPNLLHYTAEVEDGAINFAGAFQVTPANTGSEVQWSETTSWGLNPLLGWNGLTLEESQGGVIEESLARLKAVIENDSAGGGL